MADRCDGCKFFARLAKADLLLPEESKLCNPALKDADPLYVMVGRCSRYPPALLGEMVALDIAGCRRLHLHEG